MSQNHFELSIHQRSQHRQQFLPFERERENSERIRVVKNVHNSLSFQGHVECREREREKHRG